MFPKQQRFLVSLGCGFLLLAAARFAAAQIAPAGEVVIDGTAGQHYYFRAVGTYTKGAQFIYINDSTGGVDNINPVVADDGSFSGVSTGTGRTVSGQIGATTITLTYNGANVSGMKESSYGPTRAFAGRWVGFYDSPTNGFGYVDAIITSQGQVVLSASKAGTLTLQRGLGTIDTSGNLSVVSADGSTTISGLFAPANGGFFGSLTSNSNTVSVGLLRGVTSRLLNISTRGIVGSGQQVLIGGFIVGDGGKTVLIDALGPSLAAQGITNPVQSTQISLFLGSQLIASNNGWKNNANEAEIAASGVAPADDSESALEVALEPGSYTAVVSSADGSTGVGLVEIFGVGDTLGP